MPSWSLFGLASGLKMDRHNLQPDFDADGAGGASPLSPTGNDQPSVPRSTNGGDRDDGRQPRRASRSGRSSLLHQGGRDARIAEDARTLSPASSTPTTNGSSSQSDQADDVDPPLDQLRDVLATSFVRTVPLVSSGESTDGFPPGREDEGSHHVLSEAIRYIQDLEAHQEQLTEEKIALEKALREFEERGGNGDGVATD